MDILTFSGNLKIKGQFNPATPAQTDSFVVDITDNASRMGITVIQQHIGALVQIKRNNTTTCLYFTVSQVDIGINTIYLVPFHG